MRHASGNLCIDPVETDAATLAALAAEGVARIVLTHRNHFRATTTLFCATLELMAYPSEIPAPPPGMDELPYDDGALMESPRHRRQMNLLINSLQRAWHGREDFFVGGNMAVYYSELQTRQNDFRGPDVFVVLDVRKRERKSWVVWQEDGRIPGVVIELLSPSTEQVDRGEKMEIYAKVLRVPEYYLYDVDKGVLEGYALDPPSQSYRAMTPNPAGDLPCRQLGLHLGVRPGVYGGDESAWLRWLDDAGHVLPSGDERADAAQERADAAEERADAAEERADAAEERADAAAERAATAEKEAQALATRLAEYEKKFGPK